MFINLVHVCCGRGIGKPQVRQNIVFIRLQHINV